MELLLGKCLNKDERKEVVEEIASYLADGFEQKEEDYIIFSSLGMEPKLVNSIEACLLYKYNIKSLTVPESENIRVCVSKTCSDNRCNGILKRARVHVLEMVEDVERSHEELMEEVRRRVEEMAFITNMVYYFLGEVFSEADDE